MSLRLPTVPVHPDHPLHRMPALGYGVGTAWFKTGTSGDATRCKQLKTSVKAALDAGLTHIDDAEMYQNTELTGEAIQAWLSDHSPDEVKRSDLWITHKVNDIDSGIMAEVCDGLLMRSGLEYFDLLLIHSPCTREGVSFKKSLKSAWIEMQDVVTSGKARCIGVSNFRIGDLREILEACEESDLRFRPVCNQVEGHLFFQQNNLLDFCKSNGIVMTIYGGLIPITKGFLEESTESSKKCLEVLEVAAGRHGKSISQVLLRWAYQTGRIPITTTSKPERMLEYLGVFSDGFALSSEEVQDISMAGAGGGERMMFWTPCAKYFEERKE